ncbi:MAG: hypothetical protein HC905_18540 [Bacteroidales bacterium]|nr:hypothetical protein [Bacteroidales bacterium]
MKTIIFITMFIFLAGARNIDTQKKQNNNSEVLDTVRVASIPGFVDSLKYFKTRRENT